MHSAVFLSAPFWRTGSGMNTRLPPYREFPTDGEGSQRVYEERERELRFAQYRGAF